MIKAIQDYLETIYQDITFGQIQDTPDSMINVNIIDTGQKPFFNDNKTHILNVSLYVRESSFDIMQNKNGEVSGSLLNLYSSDISTCNIINTKQLGSQNPERDIKNRYYILSTFEMIVEEK